MPTITLSATPKGNGYQATVTFPDGVSISSAETYSSIAEAMTAAATKLLDMPERLEALDRLETWSHREAKLAGVLTGARRPSIETHCRAVDESWDYASAEVWKGNAFPYGRAAGLGRPLLRGHPATPRE